MKYLVKRVHLWNVNSFKAQRNCISKCRILSAHNIHVHAKSNLHNDKELKMKMLFKPLKAINKVIVQKLMLAEIFLSFSSSLRADPYFSRHRTCASPPAERFDTSRGEVFQGSSTRPLADLLLIRIAKVTQGLLNLCSFGIIEHER